MKFNNILFAIAVVLIFTSCEKNDENKSYRILRACVKTDRFSEIDSFFYDCEKLIRIKSSYNDDGEWFEISREEISYSDDQITLIAFDYLIESNSFEPIAKTEFIMDEGLRQEERIFFYNDDSWELNRKMIYQYSENNLKSWQICYSDGNGGFYPGLKCDYTYQCGVLNEILISGNRSKVWEPMEKRTYSYDDESNLLNWTFFRKDQANNWAQDYKEDLFYTEDQIAEIDGFTWNSTNWIPSGGYTYSYNNNGYLCETINDYSSTTYEYEEGNGNAKFFYFHPEDWVSGHPMIESAKHKRKPYHKRILNLR